MTVGDSDHGCDVVADDVFFTFPCRLHIVKFLDVVVGDANQAIGSVITAVDKLKRANLRLTIVAEDDVAGGVEHVVVGPAVNEVATRCGTHNFYQCLAWPTVLTKGVSAAVYPCVRRAKAAILKVAVQAGFYRSGASRDDVLGFGSDSALLGSLNCWQILRIIAGNILASAPVVVGNREFDEDVAGGVLHLEALVGVIAVVEDCANALLVEECAVEPVLSANVGGWES